MRERVDGVQIGRVGDGHGDLAITFENGNDAVFFGDMARDDGNDVVGNAQTAELNDFRAELRGLGLGDVRGADELVGQQQVHHAHAGSFGFLARFGDLVSVDNAQVHQHICQIIVFFSHGSSIHAPFVWKVKKTTVENGDVNAEHRISAG